MEIVSALLKQLESNFCLTPKEKEIITDKLFEEAEKISINSLSGFGNKYFTNVINPFNSVIYGQFLYWLSHLSYSLNFQNN